MTFTCGSNDWLLQSIIAAAKVIAVSEKNVVKVSVGLFSMDPDFILFDSATQQHAFIWPYIDVGAAFRWPCCRTAIFLSKMDAARV